MKARGWRVFATCRQEADCQRLRDEGLERAEQRDGLRAMGCTLGQGYLFARPMAADDLAAFVREPVRGPSVVEMYAPDRGRRRHASGVPDERS